MPVNRPQTRELILDTDEMLKRPEWDCCKVEFLSQMEVPHVLLHEPGPGSHGFGLVAQPLAADFQHAWRQVETDNLNSSLGCRYQDPSRATAHFEDRSARSSSRVNEEINILPRTVWDHVIVKVGNRGILVVVSNRLHHFLDTFADFPIRIISKTVAPKPVAKRKRASRKAQPKTKGLEAADCSLDTASADIREVVNRVEKEGGTIVGSCRDPFGGSPLVIAVLPIDSVVPTPFQRDLSEAHHKKLAGVIEKTGTFLDPVISVLAPGNGFWTPNGRHRLAAMRRLGARAITSIITPNRQLAWQILALNTEKAHNLKERSLEVVRIYRGLIEEDDSRNETDFAYYLEEAALVTLGLCYEQKPVFAGGAYHPILRRVEAFEELPLKKTVKQHENRAGMVLDLEEKVANVVARLKERGLTSPYLRSFVVARINPLRWIKGEPPAAEDVLKTMRERVSKFNVDKVKPQDLASMAGAPPDEEN